MTDSSENLPAVEIEVTPEMIQAVKRVIESREAFVYVDEVLGVEVLDDDARIIASAVLRTGGCHKGKG